MGSETVTLVDTNVLLDVVTDDPTWGAWSVQALAEAFDTGAVAINSIIYAEMSVRYDSIEALDAALPTSILRREDLPYAAGFLAGKAFQRYRRRGGVRRSPLADFYIGAHAAVLGYRLLTRDEARYRTYYPKLTLITP